MQQPDFLIVGSGFFGAVLAERLSSQLKASVLVLERREHIGGNCYSAKCPTTGIEYHQYGTHIFHTSNEKVWNYLTQFCAMNGYHHQVLTQYKNQIFQMPINLETINQFYGKSFKPMEARAFIQSEIAKEKIELPRNLEEQAIKLIGRPLYEAFIRDYTRKQWDCDPRELPAKIIKRLPIRFNYCEDYFNNCRWQGIPVEGYTPIFENLFDSPRIEVRLATDYFSVREKIRPRRATIYTGPIDRLFNYAHGKLNWRSIRLEREIVDTPDFQGTSVMNYAELEFPYTRIHEPRHLHPERRYTSEKTIVFREYSENASEDPYYPINSEINMLRVEKYRKCVEGEKDLIVGGRLGDYAYYDMDMTIAAALKCFEVNFAGLSDRNGLKQKTA